MNKRTLKIPAYTSKDTYILVGSMLPISILINSFLFGKRYFTEADVFGFATIVTFSLMAVSFVICGFIAVILRNRFPQDAQTVNRMALSIVIFVLLSAVILSFIFRMYEYFNFLNYSFNEYDFTRAFLSLCIMNVFLTFLHEGISKYEIYRATVTETEELKKEYMRSSLLGLKSQVNPHFLFNSLNTLSCLINDDAEKAEKFLDEMSKVYRSMLNSGNEQLVEVETELGILRSYFYLLKERYGEGLRLHIDVNEAECRQMIPPLTLQILFEKIISCNIIRKDQPLQIEILSADNCRIQIRYMEQAKACPEDAKAEAAYENVRNKFRLLCKQDVVFKNDEPYRIIVLPLIKHNEISAA